MQVFNSTPVWPWAPTAQRSTDLSHTVLSHCSLTNVAPISTTILSNASPQQLSLHFSDHNTDQTQRPNKTADKWTNVTYFQLLTPQNISCVCVCDHVCVSSTTILVPIFDTQHFSMSLHAFKPHLSRSKPAIIILNTCYGTRMQCLIVKYIPIMW